MEQRKERLLARFREFAADYSPGELAQMAHGVSDQIMRGLKNGTRPRPNHATLRAVRDMLFAQGALSQEEWASWARPAGEDVLAAEALAVAAAMEEPEEERTRYLRAGTLVACLNELHDTRQVGLAELERFAERVMARERFEDEERDVIAEWLDASRRKTARNGKSISSAQDRPSR